MIPPSALIHPLLKCWFVIIPLGQFIQIHRIQKDSAKKTKSFKTVGDTQTTSDMGSRLLICLFFIVSLIQGSQIDRRLKGKTKLQRRKTFY